MHQNQQLISDRAPSALLPTIGPYRPIFSTAGPPWSDQIKRGLRQHPSLPSVPYRPTFQQLTPPGSNEDLASTHPYHRPIQAKFGSFSAGMTSRRQRYMEIFWWFSYRKIFSSIFLHELNFDFIQFILSMG